jgi:hypothetical protein
MTPPPLSSALASPRKVIDILLGAVVMGTVGALIGVLMGDELIVVAIGIGVAMGVVIGMFVAGTDKISFGAGAGAAMGGFLGVQSSMLLDLWAEHKRTAGAKES